MKKVVPALLLLFFVVSVLVIIRVKMKTGTNISAEAVAHAKDKAALKELFPLPDFSLQNQHQEIKTRASLRNKVVIANFIFTQCKTICPLMTAKMVQLQKRLNSPDIQFVSFSVDPENDTPEVLSRYAKKWAPDETRWSLFATDDKQLQTLIAGLGVTAQKTPGSVDPIMHSSVFVLIDKNGNVRGMFDSDDRKDFKNLEEAAGSFVEYSKAELLPTDGMELYHALSCVNCHEEAALAPALGGIGGTKRELETGLLATATDEYLRESIVSPQVKRTRGYPLQMPAYDTLSVSQVDALIGYIHSLPAPNGVDQNAEVAVDVICKMKVRVSPQSIQSSTDAGTFYFCSKPCQNKFLHTH